MSKKVDDNLSIEEMAAAYNQCTKAENAIKAQKAGYRDAIMMFMKGMGTLPGTEVQLGENITVSYSRPTPGKKIVEEKLLAAGVGKEVIDQCTEVSEQSERISVKVKAAPQAKE